MNNQSKKPILAEVDLNDAEKVVLAAFRAGQQDTGDLDGAEIRGDFLRRLFLGHYDEQADYRGGIYIVGAKIPDVLDMEKCKTEFPVQFLGCTFAEQVKMQQLKCPELGFDTCILEKGMHATYTKVGGDVSLGRGFVAKGKVSLSGADIGGQLVCSGGHFFVAGGVAFAAQGIKVAQDVFLDVFNEGIDPIQFTAMGRVTLAGADIRGRLDCEDGHFLGGMFLPGAKIGGQFLCSGGYFQEDAGGNALHAQNIQAGDVFLDSGFAADGLVSLADANIGGQLVCRGGWFQNAGWTALLARGIKVASGVFFNDGFTADGEVNLSGADLSGQLDCRGGRFLNAEGLNAQDIKVAGDMLFGDGLTADGQKKHRDEVRKKILNEDVRKKIEAEVQEKLPTEVRGTAMFSKGGKHIPPDVRAETQNMGWKNLPAGDRENFPVEVRDKNVHEVWHKLSAKIQKKITVVGCESLSADVRDNLVDEIRKNLGSEGWQELEAKCKENLETECYKQHLNDLKKNRPEDLENIEAECLDNIPDKDKYWNRFTAEGRVNLAGADIGGQFVCRGGHFQNAGGEDALSAQGTKVAQNVVLVKVTAGGQVNLAYADIGGRLECSGGHFQNAGRDAFFARGAKVAQNVLLDNGFAAEGRVSLAHADIRGDLELKKCQLTHLDLANANVSGTFKDTPNAYKNSDADDSRKGDDIGIHLDIDGFRYGRLDVADEDASRVEFRLKWVGFMSKGDRFYPRPYKQLMKFYQEIGRIDWAGDVGYEMEKRRGKYLKRANNLSFRKKFSAWGWGFWYPIMGCTLGYGHKPLRIMLHVIPLIIISMLLFAGASSCPNSSPATRTEAEAWWQHCMVPSGHEYPRFRPAFYAVEVVIPVLPLGQTGYWHPKNWWVGLIQALLTIYGSFIVAILASYGISILLPGGRVDR